MWQYVRAKRTCPSCGTRPEEWLESEGGDQHAYTAVVERCRGCEVKQAEEQRVRDKPLGGGVFVRLQRR